MLAIIPKPMLLTSLGVGDLYFIPEHGTFMRIRSVFANCYVVEGI